MSDPTSSGDQFQEDDPVSPFERTLAQDPSENQGRIGYGRLSGKYTPLALGLILILVMVAVGLYNQRHDDKPPRADVPIGSSAPDFTGTTFTGEPFSLAAQRGKVVVLNFWWSGCDPCQRESPLLQAQSMADPDGLVVVGVDLKFDGDYPSRQFAEKYGITYPLMSDNGPGGTELRGPIELAYNIAQFYPTTIFISPDGVIVSYHIGELTEKQLNAAIAEARTRTG